MLHVRGMRARIHDEVFTPEALPDHSPGPQVFPVPVISLVILRKSLPLDEFSLKLCDVITRSFKRNNVNERHKKFTKMVVKVLNGMVTRAVY